MSVFEKYTRRSWRVFASFIVSISFAAICIAMLMTVWEIFLRAASTVVETTSGVRPRWGVFGLVDLTQLAMMFAVPFAVAAAFAKWSHIRMDLFLHKLPASLQRSSLALSAILGLLLLGICLWTGFGEIQSQLSFPSTSSTLGLSYVWYWLPFVAGLSLCFIACAAALVRVSWGTPTDPMSEENE